MHLWDARQGQSGGARGVAHLDLREAVGAAAVSAADQTQEGFQVCASGFFLLFFLNLSVMYFCFFFFP